jgi:hypothetical protein
MSEPIVIARSLEDALSDPDRLRVDMQAGVVIRITDMGYTIAPPNSAIFVGLDEDYDENEEMPSLQTDKTGVDMSYSFHQGDVRSMARASRSRSTH